MVHKGENRIKIPKQQSRTEMQRSACKNCPWWKDPFNKTVCRCTSQKHIRRKRPFLHVYPINFRFWHADTPTDLDLSPLYPPPFPATVQLSSLVLPLKMGSQSSVFLALVFYFVLNASFCPSFLDIFLRDPKFRHSLFICRWGWEAVIYSSTLSSTFSPVWCRQQIPF